MSHSLRAIEERRERDKQKRMEGRMQSNAHRRKYHYVSRTSALDNARITFVDKTVDKTLKQMKLDIIADRKANRTGLQKLLDWLRPLAPKRFFNRFGNTGKR